MKNVFKVVLAAVMAVVFAGTAAQAQNIQYTLVEPERFTDFSIQGMNADRTAAIFEREFQRQLLRSSLRWIPANHTLTLTITDIDMAGDIQPWRNRNHAQIRYIETIYPPRMSFSYVLSDAAGNVVREGEQNLVDLSFNFGIPGFFRNESFHFEFNMLANWIRDTFRPLTL